MEFGVKYDGDKPRWDLMPMAQAEEIVKVLTFGAKKYPSADNWKRVEGAKDRYFAAALRHLTAWKNGEQKDKETGLSHLAHAGCCLLFLQWFDTQETVQMEKIVEQEGSEFYRQIKKKMGISE
jgi:hypothetical protein